MNSDHVEARKEDRISQLPDRILSIILSRLPMKDLVKTSALSNRWKHLWAPRTDLNFDVDDIFGTNHERPDCSSKHSKHYNEFKVEFASYVIGLGIEELELILSGMALFSYYHHGLLGLMLIRCKHMSILKVFSTSLQNLVLLDCSNPSPVKVTTVNLTDFEYNRDIMKITVFVAPYSNPAYGPLKGKKITTEHGLT
ncbi:hypothetical protein POTOM_053895 [Populus tomentosa]|uniref:F-box domain-containing protein n=1 Tax=Populus tomentosa TaxID=118781 RepID=A0A8X7Y2P9_POPTO|nr:hypothetical protein POTOM_053895 [Populus tomentosa]